MKSFTKWVAIWGNAISITEHKPETYAKNLTLRYPIYSPFYGNKVRLTFDNFCGTEAVTIDKITVAREIRMKTYDERMSQENVFGGDIDTETLVSVPGMTIPAGERVTTDPIEFDVTPNDKITISFYLKDFTEMRSGVVALGKLSEAYFSVGDLTEAEVLDPEVTKPTDTFYFLSDVEVFTEEKNRAIICYGDSITAQDWPDELALLLKQEGVTDTAIVRKAASGTRILKDYSCITYESYGLSGEKRVPREFDVSGADAIIIQQGINDIIHPVGVEINQFRPITDLPSAQEMMVGMEMYIDAAEERGLKIYIGTILPIYGWRTYAPFREMLKNEFNDLLKLRSKESDNIEIIDFHAALQDSEHPEKFGRGYDSGDHLHPSKKAYKRMASEAYDVVMRK